MTVSYVYALYDIHNLKQDDELTIYQSPVPQKYEAAVFPVGAATAAPAAVRLRICDRSNRQLAAVVLHETGLGEISYPEIDIELDDDFDESSIVSRLVHAAMLTARFEGYAYLSADSDLDEFTTAFGLRSTRYDIGAGLSAEERMLPEQENADIFLPLVGTFEPSIRPIEVHTDAGIVEVRVPYASERLLLIDWVSLPLSR